MIDPLAVRCRHCGAGPGAPCVNRGRMPGTREANPPLFSMVAHPSRMEDAGMDEARIAGQLGAAVGKAREQWAAERPPAPRTTTARYPVPANPVSPRSGAQGASATASTPHPPPQDEETR